jgi:hypothetical protein
LKAFLAAIVAVLVILFLALQVVMPGAYFATQVVTSTKTIVPQSVAIEAVNESLSQHIQFLESGNASALVPKYWESANVTWTGRAYCFSGTYNGRTQITEALNSFLKVTTPGLTIMNLTRTITAQSNGLVVTVNSTFGFSTNKTTTIGSHTYPGINGMISAQDIYAYQRPMVRG